MRSTRACSATRCPLICYIYQKWCKISLGRGRMNLRGTLSTRWNVEEDGQTCIKVTRCSSWPDELAQQAENWRPFPFRNCHFSSREWANLCSKNVWHILFCKAFDLCSEMCWFEIREWNCLVRTRDATSRRKVEKSFWYAKKAGWRQVA